MNINDADFQNRVIFNAIVGSNAYGLNVPTSDVDHRGIYVNSRRELLSLHKLPDEVKDPERDRLFYGLRKFFELAKDCNPNIIEYLFLPERCHLILTPAMELILQNRHLFVSKKSKHTFSGYAFAQVKKATGQNKLANNPLPKEKPTKEQFCHFIESAVSKMPVRPTPVPASINLDSCKVSSVEHIPGLYRLYKNGNGMFRDGNLVCESIPSEQEWKEFLGLIYFNKDGFEKALRDHANYWEWEAKRNTQRWVKKDDGTISYDCKNCMHTLRILKSGLQLLRTGEPLIECVGEWREYLMNVRTGIVPYEGIMALATSMNDELESCYESSPLPHSADLNAIDDLYLQVVEMSQ